MNSALAGKRPPFRFRPETPMSDEDRIRFCAANDIARVEREVDGEILVMSARRDPNREEKRSDYRRTRHTGAGRWARLRLRLEHRFYPARRIDAQPRRCMGGSWALGRTEQGGTESLFATLPRFSNRTTIAHG